MIRIFFSFVFTGFCHLAVMSSSYAASSPWFETDGARIRLILLAEPDGLSVRGGLQFELDKGWKTYWRNPGNAGLPPILDFGRSMNLTGTTMRHPVPVYFSSDGSIGYKKSVTLPIYAKKLFTDRPATLRAKGLVGVCAEICIPVEIDLSVTLNPQAKLTKMDEAFAVMSGHSGLAKQPSASQKLLNVKVDANKVKANITASVPAGTETATLFVEGPQNWYLTVAKLISIENERAKFELPLRDVKDWKAAEGTQLTYTLRVGKTGVEQTLALPRPEK